MRNINYFFTLFVLFLIMNSAASWDLALTSGNDIEFYEDKLKSSSVGVRFQDLKVLAYDAVYDILLFVDVDKDSEKSYLYSYSLTTKKVQELVARNSYDSIRGLAFDPVTGTIFWTDINERSIYWISLNSNTTGSITFDNEIPNSVAVDSCRGYIYWTNSKVPTTSISRAKFFSNESEVIVSQNIDIPVSIVVDQRTKKLYWIDDKYGAKFSVESSNLDGGNRRTLYSGSHHQPTSLSISKDSIYWIDLGYNSIWQLPKSGKSDELVEVTTFSRNDKPFSIVANYKLKDQIWNQESAECEALKTVKATESELYDFFNVPEDSNAKKCKNSLCHNFCLKGNCSISNNQTICRCEKGYKGKRCEIDICHGYCLNDGKCSIHDNQIPKCECLDDYEGARCESLTEKTSKPNAINGKFVQGTLEPWTEKKVDNVRSTVSGETKSSKKPAVNDTDAYLSSEDSCYLSWDPIRDPVIISLGTLCLLLCIVSTMLLRNIVQLNRKPRPRIKRHIIVNRNGAPLTARPEQCEITIENCCNMNICETPCFEPRSTIRPTLLKPSKEEKSNLINNMELPDDF